MYEELQARAHFKKGDYVKHGGVSHMIIGRYYRRSEDGFVYDIEKVTMGQRRAPKLYKVREEELTRY